MKLRSEWRAAKGERLQIETVYLGGGTPSQLTTDQLRQLFIYINKVYPLTSQEITIEVNPDDVTADYAATLRQLGINRVSMGAQTFDEGRLRFLNRRHTAAQVSEAVSLLRQAGIRNISIDLMYGFPSETLSDWDADITKALALDVEHISCYCLMYEEGTPLYRLLQQGKVAETDEEQERQMYYHLIDRLEAAGYEHYEISNFARSGFRSRHNSSYWDLTPYIGLGAAAHSFDGHSRRRWNVSDISLYIEGIESGQPCFEQELLDDDTRYNDTLTVALRTRNGLDLNALSEHNRNYCLSEARHYISDGLLNLQNNHLSLTKPGLFVSDMIISDLMLI
jgi:oxygen-independent coproporphyrinogen-3 oxidase